MEVRDVGAEEPRFVEEVVSIVGHKEPSNDRDLVPMSREWESREHSGDAVLRLVLIKFIKEVAPTWDRGIQEVAILPFFPEPDLTVSDIEKRFGVQ
jgi:hypothetical protein